MPSVSLKLKILTDSVRHKDTCVIHSYLQAIIRRNVSGLLEILKDDRYAWMRLRISETWPQWSEAIKQLSVTQQNVFNRKKKKVNRNTFITRQ